MATESYYTQDQNSRNRGGTEPIKKLKKWRSIKLSRLPSSKPSIRRAKSRFDHHPAELICDAVSSQKPPSIKVSDASSNYMKATSCLDAKKEHIQASPHNSESSIESNASYSSRSNTAPPGHKSTRILTRMSSLKQAKTLTRMSSLKFRRPLVNKKLNKSRSIKLRQSTRQSKPQFEQDRIDLSSNASTPHKPSPLPISNMSPNYLKTTSRSDLRKACFQASLRNSECSSNGTGQKTKNSRNSKPSSASPSLKSARTLTRKASMKPVRILTKMASLKAKRPLVRKCSKVSPTRGDLSVNRATCSSTLKNSKFADFAELEPGGSDSKGLSVMKVCPYTYCSLNGHCHAPMPPLRRFLSIRRRLLKTLNSTKVKSVPPLRAKHSGDTAISETASASTPISPVTEELGMDFFLEIYDKRGAESLGGGTRGEDDEASEATDINWKEESVASNLDYGDNNSILDDSQSDSVDFSLPQLEDPGSFNKIPLKEKIVSSCHEEDPVNIKFLQEAHEEIISSLNSKFCHDDVESKDENVEIDDLVSDAGEPSDTFKSTTPDALVEPIAISSLVSSNFVRDPLEGLTVASEVKNENSEPDCNTGAANEAQSEKQKNIRMWHLIYQSVKPGIAAKVGTQLQLDGLGKEEQLGGSSTLLQEDISGSCQGFSKTDQDMGMENYNAACQKIKLCQMEAIKLVEEAIDEIPLPDQDLLERNNGEGVEQSILTPMDSAKDSFREFDNIKERNRTRLDPDETRLKPDNITTLGQERTTNAGSKSNQRMGRSWSNLKKLILLKRFIKALEKVRPFNPREPRYLPLEPDPEAEKIHLRHQTMEERKSAEEWMLDYALQQVVGKLTPARKRKVELLVEAFETVIPLWEFGTFRRQNAAVFTCTDPVQASGGSSIQSEGTRKENDCGNLAEVLLVETSYPEKGLVDSPELKEKSPEFCFTKTKLDKSVAQPADVDWKEKETGASNLDNSILNGEEPISVDICPPELEVPRLCGKLSLKPDETVSTYHEEVLVVGKAFQEVHEEIVSSLKPHLCNGDSESNGEKLDTNALTSVAGQSSARTNSPNGNDSEELTAIKSMVSSASICDPSLDLAAARKDKNRDSEPDYKFLQGFPPPDDSAPNSTTYTVYKTQLEEQKYNKMWRMIYQHVVTGSAAKVGSQLHIHGVDEEEEVDDANRLHTINNSGSCQNLSEIDKDMGWENRNAGHEKIELSQLDAVKLVEEAIDEIFLPEVQDQSSDDQSITSDAISDKNLSKGTWLKTDEITTPEQDKSVPKVGRKSNQQLPRSWSNLKKIILLKRFIKALEKVRKFNPQKPRHLPMEPDPEAEKIDLRHQTVEQRKSAEEWMLDYAVQQVVTKLTPARKRRVELLVEAFETVIPLSEFEAPEKHNRAFSSHARPTQARD